MASAGGARANAQRLVQRLRRAHRLMSCSQRESSPSAESAVLWASGPLSQTSASVSSVCRSSGGCPHLCKRSYNSPLTINSRASRSWIAFLTSRWGTERPSSRGRWWLMPCKTAGSAPAAGFPPPPAYRPAYRRSAAGGCQRLCQRAVKPPGDAHRQHEAVNQSGAQDTDGDLFHPSDREVKDGRARRRRGNQSGSRCSPPAKSVSARRALKQRQTQATRDPQGQHGTTQDRLVNEGGHDEDGGRRADEVPTGDRRCGLAMRPPRSATRYRQ